MSKEKDSGYKWKIEGDDRKVSFNAEISNETINELADAAGKEAEKAIDETVGKKAAGELVKSVTNLLTGLVNSDKEAEPTESEKKMVATLREEVASPETKE